MAADGGGLRQLPSVEQLVRRLEGEAGAAGVSRPRLTATVRDVLGQARREVREAGRPVDVEELAARAVAAARRGAVALRPVTHATGVVLPPTLGRAVRAQEALARVQAVGAAYSNLELDLASKQRGSRYAHVDALLRRLTGAEDALVVNNNAAAVLLALDSLARGREVIVSRGELIEIGGEFRIPDIMARSGARLREVGTTNRTHLRDYAGAISAETALLLKVHTSNFRVVGFTASVSSRELVDLGRARGLPVMEDLGSGSLIDLRPWGFPHEPTVPEVVAAGIDVVTFSGDKLLGGPQAGVVVGRRDLLAPLKTNPLNRALRVDKLTVAALEATLAAYEAGTARASLPVLRALTEPLASVRRRARRLLAGLPGDVRERLAARLVEATSQVGGGALPTVELPTAAVALGTDARQARALDEALRDGEPPVVARVADDRLLLDCRTVPAEQVRALARAVVAAAPA